MFNSFISNKPILKKESESLFNYLNSEEDSIQQLKIIEGANNFVSGSDCSKNEKDFAFLEPSKKKSSKFSMENMNSPSAKIFEKESNELNGIGFQSKILIYF